MAETQRLTADFLAAEASARIPWTEEEGIWSVSSKNFFSHRLILREEALFALLDTGPGIKKMLGDKPPRRRTLRQFAGGTLAALDLGYAILRRDAERVSLGLRNLGSRNLGFPESGFSLLIKGPGVYKLKGLTIRASPEARAELSGFFAGLPLVVRRNYPGDYILRGGRKRGAAEYIRGTGLPASGLITAEDTRGPAAFIARGRDGFSIVLTREEGNRENRLFFSIK
jgi:tRNA(Ile)-lysidine synthase